MWRPAYAAGVLIHGLNDGTILPLVGVGYTQRMLR